MVADAHVSHAELTCRRRARRAQEAFQELLMQYVPPEKLVRCISEGLDATRIKFLYQDSGAVEAIELPDHGVRLRFVQLALKLRGWDSAPAHEPSEIVVRWETIGKD